MKNGEGMHKEIISGAANVATTGGGIASSWWLWLIDPNSAHLVTILTVVLIISQLIWGWRKFFRDRS